MIKILHEAPFCYFKNGTITDNEDCEYALVHKILSDPEYANLMEESRQKHRLYILDNSLIELGAAFGGEEYAEAIKKVKPQYYVVPDTFNDMEGNIKSCMDFVDEYYSELLPSLPLIPVHGVNTGETLWAYEYFNKHLPDDAMLALPYASAAFANEEEVEGYHTKSSVPYRPLRQALNRRKFIDRNYMTLRNRDIHLLGCMSVLEFAGTSSYDKSFIKSVDTSLPIALALEGLKFDATLPEELRKDGLERTLTTSAYKPNVKVDKLFYNNFEQDVVDNIQYFRDVVRGWYRG